MSVNKVYDTADYVTYTSVFSLYEGGAHGMASLRGVTFDKKSGSQIGYPVDSTALKALQPILREGVKSYFVDVAKNDGESVSDTDIKDFMDGLFIEMVSSHFLQLLLISHLMVLSLCMDSMR